MSGKRLIALVGALVAAASMHGACGSDEPEDKPSATPSATRDVDGFTPEKREVVDAVKAYNEAFFGRGASSVEPAIQDLVTKDLLDQVGPAESKAVDKAGLQYIGSVELSPKTVTINRDKATFRGCQDGSKAFVVKRGESTAGPGSRSVGASQLEVGLVRQDGQWLVDDPQGESVESC